MTSIKRPETFLMRCQCKDNLVHWERCNCGLDGSELPALHRASCAIHDERCELRLTVAVQEKADG